MHPSKRCVLFVTVAPAVATAQFAASFQLLVISVMPRSEATPEDIATSANTW